LLALSQAPVSKYFTVCEVSQRINSYVVDFPIFLYLARSMLITLSRLKNYTFGMEFALLNNKKISLYLQVTILLACAAVSNSAWASFLSPVTIEVTHTNAPAAVSLQRHGSWAPLWLACLASCAESSSVLSG
jgi:hypothetical protein